MKFVMVPMSWQTTGLEDELKHQLRDISKKEKLVE